MRKLALALLGLAVVAVLMPTVALANTVISTSSFLCNSTNHGTGACDGATAPNGYLFTETLTFDTVTGNYDFKVTITNEGGDTALMNGLSSTIIAGAADSASITGETITTTTGTKEVGGTALGGTLAAMGWENNGQKIQNGTGQCTAPATGANVCTDDTNTANDRIDLLNGDNVTFDFTGVLSGPDTFSGTLELKAQADDGTSGNGNAFALSNDFTLTSRTVTPEPASLALFGSGLVGIAGVLRRRIKK